VPHGSSDSVMESGSVLESIFLGLRLDRHDVKSQFCSHVLAPTSFIRQHFTFASASSDSVFRALCINWLTYLLTCQKDCFTRRLSVCLFVSNLRKNC